MRSGILGLLLTAILSSSALAQSEPRNVILISWDGCDRSVVTELLHAGQLPNLAALIAEGSSQEIEVMGHVTVTKPGHAEMLTALSASDTGVFSNRDFRPIPEGWTIFERVQERLGGREAIHTVFIAGKLSHVGGRGPEEIAAATQRSRAPRGADDTVATTEGEPFYLTRRHLDVFDAQQREASETGPLCLAALERYRDPRLLAFFHFSDPDHAGHGHGIDSAEYREAAVTCDEWLGRIRAWLSSEELSDETLVYVMTDHGFDEHARSHNRAPHSWLATNDTSVTRGGILGDVPATILERFGVDAAGLEPRLFGASLSQPAPARDLAYVVARPRAQGGGAASSEAQTQRRPLRRTFERADANGDGRLDSAEYGARPATPRPWPAFESVDANGDGAVTLEEVRTAVRARNRASQASGEV